MNIDPEMIEPEMGGNQCENLAYEQPSLKKYGTMKEFTLATGGSGSDSMSNNIKGSNDHNEPGSAEVEGGKGNSGRPQDNTLLD